MICDGGLPFAVKEVDVSPAKGFCKVDASPHDKVVVALDFSMPNPFDDGGFNSTLANGWSVVGIGGNLFVEVKSWLLAAIGFELHAVADPDEKPMFVSLHNANPFVEIDSWLLAAIGFELSLETVSAIFVLVCVL